MGLEVDFSENASKDFTPLETAKPDAQAETENKETTQEVVTEQAKPLDQIFTPLETKKDVKDEIEKNPLENKVETKKETTPIELDKEQVAAYLKAQYPDRQFEQLDELFQVQEPTIKEVEKEVNPYAEVWDEEDEAYYRFKKDTNGRPRKDFDFLNQDFDKLSPLDLAIERVKKDTGMDLSSEDAKSYLENKLKIDLSDDELSINDRIELTTYSKPYREALEAEKEKYRTPLEKAIKAKQDLPKEEYVKLDNGEKMLKSKYDDLINRRNKYVEDVKKAVDSVAATDFKVSFEDNGEKRTLEFKYDYSQDDKHSMLSDAEDIDATISKRYKAENQFNHQGLAEAMWWGEKSNQQKVIGAAMKQARAEAIEEMLANDNNETFTNRPLQPVKTSKDGYGDLPTGNETNSGFGLKVQV